MSRGRTKQQWSVRHQEMILDAAASMQQSADGEARISFVPQGLPAMPTGLDTGAVPFQHQ
jgi:hypothetical protein